MTIPLAPLVIIRRCYCPDDCNCRTPWRTNYCGCRGHRKETTR